MKMHYTYFDNNHIQWVKDGLHGKYESPKIFECIAESILEADKALEAALTTGFVKLIPKNEKTKPPKSFNMNQLSHIGCQIRKQKWWEKVLDILYELL